MENNKEKLDNYIKSINGLNSGLVKDKKIYNIAWVGDGWLPILEDLIKDLISLGWNKEICDIKEKYGTLRFYINEGSNEIHERISKAENLSASTCEACGKHGSIRTNGWWKTLCDDCNKNIKT